MESLIVPRGEMAQRVWDHIQQSEVGGFNQIVTQF